MDAFVRAMVRGRYLTRRHSRHLFQAIEIFHSASHACHQGAPTATRRREIRASRKGRGGRLQEAENYSLRRQLMCVGRDESLISRVISRAFHERHGFLKGLNHLLNTLIKRKQKTLAFKRKQKHSVEGH